MGFHYSERQIISIGDRKQLLGGKQYTYFIACPQEKFPSDSHVYNHKYTLIKTGT